MGMAPPKPARLVTKQEYDAAIAGFRPPNPNSFERKWSGTSDAEELQSFKDTMSVLPPPAPDLADEAVQKARQAARRKLLMGGMVGPLDLSGGTTKPIPGLTGA